MWWEESKKGNDNATMHLRAIKQVEELEAKDKKKQAIVNER